ncbi:undecaprenyl diphosphate synthase family protein [Phanerochaete sordida]|uniref:Alkyl transferase n=1 Tax=Phanerochaete sordida TaxID=48140 RepID=A0A9P3GQZ9_9APHY|nr:undecaprenyl diphosphate synthase family protein [Phanerochaete sordida]
MLPIFVSDSLGWFHGYASQKVQDALLAILSSGPVPRHVAFIMDGNRRYARSKHRVVAEGHAQGFETLSKVLEICMRLGVRCVSVYAFAIENFNRSPEEVEALMALAESKLIEISKHGAMLDQHGIRLNALGRRDMLPPNVRAAVEKAEEMTRKNNKAILNICMPYASRDDIASAVQTAAEKAVESDNYDITEDDVDAYMSTSAVGSPPVDILVRTSGVKRLSDYMTWQSCEDTQIQFSSRYWPDFGLWDFVPIILDYQRKVWSSPA